MFKIKTRTFIDWFQKSHLRQVINLFILIQDMCSDRDNFIIIKP